MAPTRWNFTKDVSFTWTDSEGNEHEGTATVRFYGYDDPGRCFGPVESCYPPEGDSEFEVLYLAEQPTELYRAMDAAEEAAQKAIDDGLDIPEEDGPERDGNYE